MKEAICTVHLNSSAMIPGSGGAGSVLPAAQCSPGTRGAGPRSPGRLYQALGDPYAL